MLDFVNIVISRKRTGEATIWPDFINIESKDVMIRGGKFYAIWDEANNIWSTDIRRLIKLVDDEIKKTCDEYQASHVDDIVKGMYLRNQSSNKLSEFYKYCSLSPDQFHPLDCNITFSNTETTKESYISFKLPYAISEGPHPIYDEMMTTLYAPTEREKLEWIIGSIIAGDSKSIQKFGVLYGDKGTGKGTVLKVYESLLDGYWNAFKAANLGNPNASFPLTDFKDNPPLAVDGDGDLSRLEDNTNLNSIVSHERLPINTKHQLVFYMNIYSFLLIGSNKPVKITDSKSGLLRRLIDINPTGKKIPVDRYDEIIGTDPKKITGKLKYEFGAIAYHCLSVYKELGRNHYRNYVPTSMIGATNEFFNFVADNYLYFEENGASENGVTLSAAWDKYKEYVDYANVPYPFSKRVFKEELKNYFTEFSEREGRFVNVYRGFRPDKFWKGDAVLEEVEKEKEEKEHNGWLYFDGVESAFDKEFKDIPAQYCWVDEKGNERPKMSWDKVKTTLADIDTFMVHYCMPPAILIVIDLDIKDEEGNKCLEKCIQVANELFPPTYAEVSKGGGGLHLHYWYDGDVTMLADIYSKDIEIKKYVKLTPLRRRLSKFNSLPITHISSGLPLKKGESRVINNELYENEKKLRNQLAQCLRKEAASYTTGNVTFAKKLLDEAYESGKSYDVRDLKKHLQALAASASNQSLYCTKVVSEMHFCSKDVEEEEEKNRLEGDLEYFKPDNDDLEREEWEKAPIVVFDIEVYPNRNLLCYKIYDPPGHEGEHPVIPITNPAPEDIDHLLKYRIAAYNGRKYDNHICYGMKLGYNPKEVFDLSQNMIVNKKGFFKQAYNFSYTDILDFLHEKESLKKKEIKLDITHKEMGIPWDKPITDEETWKEVIKYCCNDVLAAEAVWNSEDGQGDWEARCTLSELTGLSVNTPTNTLAEAFVFGDDMHPQDQFNFQDLSVLFPGYEFNPEGIDVERYVKDKDGKPICTASHKSIYLGEDPSNGGYNWSKPGVYGNVKCFDVASMHPSSIRILNYFGPKYTPIFCELVEVRLAIKHGDIEKAKTLCGGRFAKYLTDKIKAKKLANALKIVINAVYGCTSATTWGNRFTDERNVDNKVAKCGALFMIGLKHRVMELGYEVVHCKTDCIKVADADDFITNYIFEEGRKFGYTFEIEDWFDKFCLVNKSAYVGKLMAPEVDKDGKETWWVTKADEFIEPFVYKSLFSHEKVEFKDLRQVKSVRDGAIYLDMNESIPQMEPALIKEMEKLSKSIKKGEASKEDIARHAELCKQEEACHRFIFIGRIGSFVPIMPGLGGGLLMKDHNGKMEAVAGTKGYRWVESEAIRGTEAERNIDMSYFDDLANTAINDISDWCDYEWFVGDVKYDGEVIITMDSVKAIQRQEEELAFGENESGNINVNGINYFYKLRLKKENSPEGMYGGKIVQFMISDVANGGVNAIFSDGKWIQEPSTDDDITAVSRLTIFYDPDSKINPPA